MLKVPGSNPTAAKRYFLLQNCFKSLIIPMPSIRLLFKYFFCARSMFWKQAPEFKTLKSLPLEMSFYTKYFLWCKLPYIEQIDSVAAYNKEKIGRQAAFKCRGSERTYLISFSRYKLQTFYKKECPRSELFLLHSFPLAGSEPSIFRSWDRHATSAPRWSLAFGIVLIQIWSCKHNACKTHVMCDMPTNELC